MLNFFKNIFMFLTLISSHVCVVLLIYHGHIVTKIAKFYSEGSISAFLFSNKKFGYIAESESSRLIFVLLSFNL